MLIPAVALRRLFDSSVGKGGVWAVWLNAVLSGDFVLVLCWYRILAEEGSNLLGGRCRYFGVGDEVRWKLVVVDGSKV